MRTKGLKKLLGLLLAVVLVASVVPAETLAADSDSKRGGGGRAKQSADIVSHGNRESGLVGFEGAYALKETDKPVSVIVEFAHQPAGLVEAIAEANGEEVDASTKELNKLAKKDREDFYKALEGVKYSVKYEYTLGMNGVAVTVPQSWVDEIADLDCVFAVYPDESHENVTIDPDSVEKAEASEEVVTEVVTDESKMAASKAVEFEETEGTAEEEPDLTEEEPKSQDLATENGTQEEENADAEEENAKVAALSEEGSEEEVAEKEKSNEAVADEETPEQKDTAEEVSGDQETEPESDEAKILDIKAEGEEEPGDPVVEIESQRALPVLANAAAPARIHFIQGMEESRKYLGIDKINEAGLTGKGVTVGIIDTGIDYGHPDLANTFSSTLPNGNAPAADELLDGKFIGRNYVDNGNASNNPMDDHGHGTHVAGTIAARGENTGNISALGVAPEATIISYKAIDSENECWDTDVNAAMQDAVRDGCEIINMSLGWSKANSAVHSTNIMLNGLALQFEDVLFVLAAGNSGSASWTVGSPGTSPMALTVANARIESENRLLTLNQDGKESKLRLIRSDWSDAVIQEEGKYTLHSLCADAEGNYRMVILPTVDGSGIGTGTQEEFDAFFKTHDKKDYAGALFVVNRGEAFDDTVPRIKKQVGTGAILVMNTAGKDFYSISWWQSAYNNYLPVFTIGYQEGQELISGLTVGEPYSFSFTKAEPLHSSAPNDNGCYPAADTSIGPVKNSFDLKPDLTAPGSSIVSTIWKDMDYERENYDYAYAFMNGTSMATPHVSAIAALLRQKNPNLTALELKSILVNTADYDAFEKSVSRLAVGAGMVDPQAAVNAAAAPVIMTAPNAQAYTGSQSELVSHTVQTPTISLGMIMKGETEKSVQVTVENKSSASQTYSISLENQSYTADDSSTASQAIQSVFSTDVSSITVPAGGEAKFTLKATVSADAALGAYETTVVLGDGTSKISSPAAVYVYEEPVIEPIKDDAVITEYTFLQNAVVSSGDSRQLADYDWKDWTYLSDRTMLEFSFRDWTVESWQPLLYQDGKLLGVLDTYYTDTWFAENEKEYWYWYQPNSIGNWYAPCEIDENGDVSWGDYYDIPDGAYQVALMLKKQGAEPKIVEIADYYVDSVLPEIKLTAVEKEGTWSGAEDRENGTVIYKGNIYDAGTADMQKKGINSENNLRLYGKKTSQEDNVVVVEIGEEYFRAEVTESGDFEVAIPKEMAIGKAVVYYGDHFLPQGSEKRNAKFMDGFDPEALSYTENVWSDDIPWMNWFAYRATNMSSFEVDLDIVTAEDALRLEIMEKIAALKKEAARTDVYTPESIEKLNAAIAAAEKALEDGSMSLEELNVQLDALEKAETELEVFPGADPTPTPDPAKPGKPGTKPTPTNTDTNGKGSSTSNKVDTGDHSPFMLYVVVLGLSLSVIVGYFVYRRRRYAGR